jgi:putative acetyltransferase
MNPHVPLIRPERVEDADAVRLINELAFPEPTEARLVDAIRAKGHKTLSLVAVSDGEVVGHILFSPVYIAGSASRIQGFGLAPMAVHPAFQRQGIGSALVREGLRRLDALACPFVIVVGHAAYYPRFGFEPASRLAIQPQWEGIPDDVFLIRVLPGSTSPLVSGTAYYLPEFDQAL